MSLMYKLFKINLLQKKLDVGMNMIIDFSPINDLTASYPNMKANQMIEMVEARQILRVLTSNNLNSRTNNRIKLIKNKLEWVKSQIQLNLQTAVHQQVNFTGYVVSLLK
ncbi:Hypothetical_protein [Hexamita inflata]|uniref:Hypothetical_protein n=1 Tax=Hexamita inflata TaxID=28002 RepID=A0AA86RNR7_9EUKA|nr:Hypothetical protein HINF_LOCUS65818 [Hexamita inflata]